jgi:hypothetical protein
MSLSIIKSNIIPSHPDGINNINNSRLYNKLTLRRPRFLTQTPNVLCGLKMKSRIQQSSEPAPKLKSKIAVEKQME